MKNGSFILCYNMCSARTVAGHEAARLSSQLAASQRQRRSREAGNIVEPRARSYDHQRQEKPEKGKCALMQIIRIGEQIFAEVSVKDVADKAIFDRNINKPILMYMRAHAYIFEMCKTCTVSLTR